MTPNVTFDQFNAIASGKYNAGQIDFVGDGDRATLKKVNHHIHFTGSNAVVIDSARTVALKHAFVQAMATRLGDNAKAISEIRRMLGLPPEYSSPKALGSRTIEPLTRQEVRDIIDKYVGGGRRMDADRAAKRDAVNVENQRRIPVQIGDQTFRLDEMAAELAHAAEGGPKKSQAALVLKFLTRPEGKLDAAQFARAMNLFAFTAEQAADAPDAERDAGGLLEAAFARALDSLDNGTLSQVYQSLISREADDLKDELSRRLAKFDLTAEQAGVCERTAMAMGRLEALVLNEIAHRVKLGKAADAEEAARIMADAPVFRHCGAGVKRDLSARGQAGEMTSVNLEIVTARAGYGNVHDRDLAGKTTDDLVKLGFTKADAHDIGDLIRKSELTVNAHLSNLLGWREGQDPDNPPLFQPGYSLVNTFVSKEQKGMTKDATGYLVRRNQVERHFFPEYGKTREFKGRDRPNYAAVNMSGATQGAAPNYGLVVFVMKNHVKQQATYTLSDTFYALRFDFRTEGGKEKFLAAAQKNISKLVKPEALAALADANSKGGKALDSLFAIYKGDGIATGKGLDTNAFTSALAKFLNENRVEGAREIDTDDVMALLFEAIGVIDEEGARVAGYDNVENLLAGLRDLEPLYCALSTARRAENPNAPVRMVGGEYVEAQLHGPIVVTRDVEEMRVPVDEIECHYRNLAKDNPAITGGMEKGAWIAAKVEQDKAKLLKFGNDNGFKVTFYEDDNDAKSVADHNIARDILQAKKMLLPRNVEYARELFENRKDFILSGVYNTLPDDIRAEAQRLFGENFSNAAPIVMVLLKEAAESVMGKVKNPASTNDVQKHEIDASAKSAACEHLEGLVSGIMAAKKLGLDDEAALALMQEALAAGERYSKLISFATCRIFSQRIAGNPQAIVQETLEKELAARKAEIEALGIPGGFMLGGAAMKRMLAKAKEYLDNFHMSRKAVLIDQCLELIDQIRKDVIAPEIAARLDLLKSVDANSFPDAEMKASFFGWAMNAERIKSKEELTGVKSSSEGFYAVMSKLLSEEKDFGAATFVAALQEIMRQISAACAADNAVNHRDVLNVFTADDRNGYISRTVSVAFAAIEAKMGRKALEKLARILASPEVRGLYNAMNAAIEEEYRAAIDSQYTIVFALHERLTRKYGIAAPPANADPLDYSQVPPKVRGMLSAIDQEGVAALDARVPYAPQTTHLMPPPANPDAAPRTLAARKRALMGALPAYGSHEKTFDDGRNTHGRGHATRVFIFANALGNIMRERGVPVDMGTLATTAAGHDMGRQGSGDDHWEKDSGALVEQLAENTYPGAYGDEWKAQANLNVSAGHGPAADAQRSVEGLIMKAADSLDYTRVAPLDPKRFHFLEKTLVVGGVHVMQDEGLRRALLHEAELLAKATSPLAARREEIIRLKASDNEAERAQGQALDDEVANAERELAKLTDEQVVERIEAEIRDNPAKYPLLTKYYLDAE